MIAPRIPAHTAATAVVIVVSVPRHFPLPCRGGSPRRGGGTGQDLDAVFDGQAGGDGHAGGIGLLVGAVAAVAIAAIGDPGSLPVRLIAGAGAGGVLFLAALAYPKGMGLGDVKLAATMGLFLGRNVIPALFVALLSGSLVGLAMMARDGAAARKQAIPFGPFLALGGVVGLLFGDQLVGWYLAAFS